MYIANRRDSSKFNGCSPLQLHLGLISLKHAIAYLPYTERCAAYKKRANAQIAHLVFADTQANPEKPKELFFSQRSTKN
jgi:hypothetical protein